MPLPSSLPELTFEDYRLRFAEYFDMHRENGVIEVRMHTTGHEAQWSLGLHRAISQMLRAVAGDRENGVLILTGTGDHWIHGLDVESFATIESDDEVFKRESYHYWYRDGMNMLEALVSAVDIPTIGAMNGPGLHVELGLLCDITLCTPEARFFDPHLTVGLAPGDGLFLVLQELLGVKRATYTMHMVERIDAVRALEWGMVNEIVPLDRLLERAHVIANSIMQQDDIVRRITTQIVRRRWRRLFADEFGFHMGHEMWASLVNRKLIDHGR
jgi:enoyl-CoA hydratase/carnithine racemase